ncbi:MAG: hypothetical protein ACK4ZJ_16095, partial [Allorhizobium sp.]
EMARPLRCSIKLMARTHMTGTEAGYTVRDPRVCTPSYAPACGCARARARVIVATAATAMHQRSSFALPLPPPSGVTDAQETNLLIKVVWGGAAQGEVETLWTHDKFMDRLYLMRELYQARCCCCCCCCCLRRRRCCQCRCWLHRCLHLHRSRC